MGKIPPTWTIALLTLSVSASLAVTASPALAKCTAGDCWGAVAYGPKNAWAWEVNYNDQDTAKRLALAKCNNRCTHVLTFKNTCGAYVSGHGGHGWGTSRKKETAVGEAMTECSKVAKNCELRVWACTQR
jgi:uncharacterized protein DUF4189